MLATFLFANVLRAATWRRRRCVLAVCMLVVSIRLTTVRAQDQTVVLQNDQAKLAFEAVQGGLTTLEDKVVAHNHRDASPPGPLWTLVLDDERTLGPAQAGRTSLTLSETEHLLELRVDGFCATGGAPPGGAGAGSARSARTGKPVADLRQRDRQFDAQSIALSVSDRHRSARSRDAGGTGVDG